MILYGVTVTVDEDIAENWETWMKKEHIPAVMKTNLFQEFKMLKLLNPVPEKGTITYSIQYFIDSVQKFEQYQQAFAPALQASHKNKFGTKALAFRTLLEVIDC